MIQGKKFEFDAGDVRVTVPTQRKKAKVEKLTKDTSLEQRELAGFKPIRVVFNFQVVDEDNPQTILTEFDPKFELRVRYTPADSRAAQAVNKPLALAYWDGSTWVKFTREKHEFRLEPDAQGSGGFGVAMIGSWGDPNIVWGS